MSEIPPKLQEIHRLFFEELKVPESLQEPAHSDVRGLIAHALYVRAFASILYVREVLNVFPVVSSVTPHAVTSVLYARALAELSAINYYLRKNVRDNFHLSNLDQAHSWARRSVSGNRYLKKFFTPDSPDFKDLPKSPNLTFEDSLDLGKATKCYSAEVLQEEEERIDYEFLSEMSHPNSAATNDFLEIDLVKRTVSFKRESHEADKWDAYVAKYAARAGLEILELIKLASEIGPNYLGNSCIW